MKTIVLVIASFVAFLSPCNFCFSQAIEPVVHVVLFTHIEDNLPASDVGTSEAKTQYLNVRNKLRLFAEFSKEQNFPWVFQPDWKILLAILEYDDAEVMKSTNSKNLLRYMKEDLDVFIDPHSHEKYGYNYTDVAHLLDSLGVGGSKVIGGHVWDPSLPQFAHWDRFRQPVRGKKYPWAVWQGEILMGSATPGHVNDPVVSGVWRPKDKYHFFEDDIDGNIYNVGQHIDDIERIDELISFYDNEEIEPECMLTATYHVTPSEIFNQGGFVKVLNKYVTPLLEMQSQNKVLLTDFTSIIEIWKTKYNEVPCIYYEDKSNAIDESSDHGKSSDDICIFPNPASEYIEIRLPRCATLSKCGTSEVIRIFNALGECVLETPVVRHLGDVGHLKRIDISHLQAGVYYIRIGNYYERFWVTR